MRQYVEDVRKNGLLNKYWMIWTPVQFVAFGIVPEHYRIAFVTFFWLILLSSISTRASEGGLDGLTCD